MSSMDPMDSFRGHKSGAEYRNFTGPDLNAKTAEDEKPLVKLAYVVPRPRWYHTSLSASRNS